MTIEQEGCAPIVEDCEAVLVTKIFDGSNYYAEWYEVASLPNSHKWALRHVALMHVLHSTAAVET